LDERAKKFHLNPEEEFVPTSKKKEAIPEPQPKKKSRKYKKEKSPEPVIVNLPTFAKKLMDEYERNKLLQIHLDQANNQIKLLQYEIEKLKKPHDKELKKEINKKMNKLKDYTKYPEGLYGDSLDFTKKNRAVMESNKFFVNNENKNGKQDKIIDSIRANSTNLDTNSTFIDYTSNTVLHDYIHTSRSSVEPYDPFIRASNTNLQHSRSGINSSSNVQQPRLPSPQLTNFRSGDGYVLPPIISNPSNNNVMDFSNVGQFDYPDRSVLPPIISNRSPDRSVLPSNLSNNNVMDFSNVGQFDYPDRSVLPPIISNPSNNNVMDFSNVGQFDSPNRSVLPSNPSNNNVIDFSNVHLFPADTTLNTTTVKGPIRDSD
jgi:FtsZ-binding cell division protein ZapB